MILLKTIKTKLKWALTRCPSPHERKLNDVVIYPIQDHAYLAVYWKDLPIGKGPCVSLYVHDKEILKFDCFGEDRGHYHTNLIQPIPIVNDPEGRIYFMERTVKEQIERSIFEIEKNISYYLKNNPYSRIKFFEIDRSRLETGCRQAKAKMLEYAAV